MQEYNRFVTQITKNKYFNFIINEIFVLPTHSENFGIVIAEALCCGIPVITTTGTPWDVLERCNAGKWISVGENPLKVALESLMSKTDEEREAMGNNGRKLIRR